MRRADLRRTPRRRAEVWLRDMLAEGPRPATAVIEGARVTGLSWITVRRAKGDLGVSSVKVGYQDGWVWSLPVEEGDHLQRREGDHLGPEGDQFSEEGDHFAGRGSLRGINHNHQPQPAITTTTTSVATPVAKLAPPGAINPEESSTGYPEVDEGGSATRTTSKKGRGVVVEGESPSEGDGVLRDDAMTALIEESIRLLPAGLPPDRYSVEMVKLQFLGRGNWRRGDEPIDAAILEALKQRPAGRGTR